MDVKEKGYTSEEIIEMVNSMEDDFIILIKLEVQDGEEE